MTVKELVEKLAKLQPEQHVILLVGNLWGDLTVAERMGDTVILSADNKNIIHKPFWELLFNWIG